MILNPQVNTSGYITLNCPTSYCLNECRPGKLGIERAHGQSKRQAHVCNKGMHDTGCLQRMRT